MTTKKDHLTNSELELFLRAAKTTSHPVRDYCMWLLAFRHGLRVSELISLSAREINLEDKIIFVRRSKGSLSTNQPLGADEIDALRKHMKTPYYSAERIFLTGAKEPFTRFGAHFNVKMIGRKVDLEVHPHMLRHSCGYYLANKGFDIRLIQDYLGHKDIHNTVRYTKVNHERFKGMFDGIGGAER